MKNKRRLKKIITDILAFIAGCTMFRWYAIIFLEKLLD